MQILTKPLMKSLLCAAILAVGALTACNSASTSSNGSEIIGGGGSSTSVNQNKETTENKNADNRNNDNKAETKPSPEKPKSELLEFKKGESYTSVREKLLTAGWTPHRSKDADECYEGDKRCQGRPEMQSCAGTGLGNCRFLWKRDKKVLVIFTVGEDANYHDYEFETENADGRQMPPRADDSIKGKALVFAPPSMIRKSPGGEVLCKVEKKILITLQGSTNVYDNNGFWIYTDHCGKMGVIHSSQVNIAG